MFFYGLPMDFLFMYYKYLNLLFINKFSVLLIFVHLFIFKFLKPINYKSF